MNNPFKFGTIVDGEYFTDRVAEQEKVREILASENHLILISPRRFGKTSLVQKVTKGLSRPVFQLNLQVGNRHCRLCRTIIVDYASAVSYGTSETSYHSLSFYPHHFNQSHDGWHRSFISAVNGWLHSVRGCIHTD